MYISIVLFCSECTFQLYCAVLNVHFNCIVLFRMYISIVLFCSECTFQLYCSVLNVHFNCIVLFRMYISIVLFCSECTFQFPLFPVTFTNSSSPPICFSAISITCTIRYCCFSSYVTGTVTAVTLGFVCVLIYCPLIRNVLH